MDSCLAGGALLVQTVFDVVSSLLHWVPATMITVVRAVLETQSRGTALVP
jgi:hypothetical protein